MPSLDPTDWSALRSLGHRMLDDMFDQLGALREGPVWREMPAPLRQEFRAPLPRGPVPPGDDGRLVIRAAILNHRSETIDADNLLAAVLHVGRQRRMRAA